MSKRATLDTDVTVSLTVAAHDADVVIWPEDFDEISANLTSNLKRLGVARSYDTQRDVIAEVQKFMHPSYRADIPTVQAILNALELRLAVGKAHRLIEGGLTG